ncbi:hypothetical protein F7725_005741 [Dissostichus mawsoni]|uniref:Glutamate [NMDA] receptor epsilon subunit C-terminal domain-containing protein n=1 Tax=Dissostichus mawsoni TaxID=36200 RepID=A0A7J5YSC1_DISMA|nr:hypothetical protein F7725_005741 [Dissostichus mawsoni]
MSGKGNSLHLPRRVLVSIATPLFLSLSGDIKTFLTMLRRPCATENPALQTSPNKPQLSITNDNGKTRPIGLPSLPSHRAQNLEPCGRKTQAHPGRGPGPPQMKSQRYLPEEPPHSDISSAPAGRITQRFDSMAARGGFKPINQLRKRGGVGAGGEAGEEDQRSTPLTQTRPVCSQLPPTSETARGEHILTHSHTLPPGGCAHLQLSASLRTTVTVRRPTCTPEGQEIQLPHTAGIYPAEKTPCFMLLQVFFSKDKTGGSFEAPGGGQGSQSVRPGHCRSCLTKLSSYSGLYTSAPGARCDACAHLGNLYDISEDHLHSQLLPHTHSPTQRGHAYTIFPRASWAWWAKGRALAAAHPLRGLSLPDRDREREREREREMDEGAYANVLTMRSDRPFSSRSPHSPSPSHTHSLDAPMPLPRRSKSLFPIGPIHNPFLQSAPGTTQRDPSRSLLHACRREAQPTSSISSECRCRLPSVTMAAITTTSMAACRPTGVLPSTGAPVVAYMVPPAALSQ